MARTPAEQLALTLTEGGMQRMTARVMAPCCTPSRRR